MLGPDVPPPNDWRDEPDRFGSEVIMFETVSPGDPQLTCLFCGLYNCELELVLRGLGITRETGVHAKCLDHHVSTTLRAVRARQEQR
jgi:hypothetical protein